MVRSDFWRLLFLVLVLSSWPFSVRLIVCLKNVTLLPVSADIAENLKKVGPVLSSGFRIFHSTAHALRTS